jgi:hypothetical protein
MYIYLYEYVYVHIYEYICICLYVYTYATRISQPPYPLIILSPLISNLYFLDSPPHPHWPFSPQYKYWIRPDTHNHESQKRDSWFWVSGRIQCLYWVLFPQDGTVSTFAYPSISRYTITYSGISLTQSEPLHALSRYINVCIERELTTTVVIMTLGVKPLLVRW